MKERLEEVNATSGILLEDELHEDFTKLFEEQTNAVLRQLPKAVLGAASQGFEVN